MIIQVDQTLNEGSVDLDASFSNLDLTREIKLVGAAMLKGTLSVEKDNEISFTGILRAKVILICVKCLEDFEEDFAIEIIETYYPVDRVKDAPKEDGFRELFANLQSFSYEHGRIDLDKVARDNLVAAVPVYPRCPKCRETNAD